MTFKDYLAEAKDDKKIVSVGQKTRGVMIVQTKDGEKYEVTGKDTGGEMPRVGKLITDYIKLEDASVSDMKGPTDKLEKALKELKGYDVIRSGSNGLKIKCKDSGAVASVVLDPMNKF